jgi:hypothetical protein
LKACRSVMPAFVEATWRRALPVVQEVRVGPRARGTSQFSPDHVSRLLDLVEQAHEQVGCLG